MNIIVIVSDTLRRDHLGCYGNPWISTPHIDRFAANAMVFENAYAASFPTVPNRHDIMTGRYTYTHAKWAPLPRDEVILSEELGKAGYTSMMILDTPHIVNNGFHYDRGFDGWEWIRGQESDRWWTSPSHVDFDADHAKIRNAEFMIHHHQRNKSWWRYEEDTCVARTMTCACRWLEENRGVHDNFFLYVDTFDPHEPWDAPEWYVNRYTEPYQGERVTYPLYGPSDYLSAAELAHLRAMYAGEVTLVDRWVGRLLERIEDLGLLDDTLVILTTDHGFLHGEHNWTGKLHITPEWARQIQLYEEIAHIPFIMHYPGASPCRLPALIQPPDLMPTFLDIAQAPDPGTMQGRSLLSLIEGKADSASVSSLHEFAVTSPSIIEGAGGGERATITTSEWSFICAGHPLVPEEYVTLAVDGLPKTIQPGGVQMPSELYHLPSDPHQEHDVIGDHPEVAAELRTRYVAFLTELDTNEAFIAPWREA